MLVCCVSLRVLLCVVCVVVFGVCCCGFICVCYVVVRCVVIGLFG